MANTAPPVLESTPVGGLEQPAENQADTFLLPTVCDDGLAQPRAAAAAHGTGPDQVADLLVSSATALYSLAASMPKGENQKKLEVALSSFVSKFVEEHSKLSTCKNGHASENSPWAVIGVGLCVYHLASDMPPGDLRSLLIDAASQFVDRGLSSLP